MFKVMLTCNENTFNAVKVRSDNSVSMYKLLMYQIVLDNLQLLELYYGRWQLTIRTNMRFATNRISSVWSYHEVLHFDM